MWRERLDVRVLWQVVVVLLLGICANATATPRNVTATNPLSVLPPPLTPPPPHKPQQGRKRQVGLVMGLLRADLDEASLSKLSEAVQQAARYNLPYSDADVEQQLDVWMEGLIGNDQVGVFNIKHVCRGGGDFQGVGFASGS